MLPSRRAEINRLADEIRERLELTELPVDVEHAIKRLGGQIEEIDFLSSPGEEASVRKAGDRFVVRIEQYAASALRKRFSLAHEVGHLFLHMGYIIDPMKWQGIDEYRDSPKYRYGHSEEEFEAHEFAGAFLMPKKSYVQLISEDRATLQSLASTFGVSIDAARTRGRWLNLLAWE